MRTFQSDRRTLESAYLDDLVGRSMVQWFHSISNDSLYCCPVLKLENMSDQLLGVDSEVLLHEQVFPSGKAEKFRTSLVEEVLSKIVEGILPAPYQRLSVERLFLTPWEVLSWKALESQY